MHTDGYQTAQDLFGNARILQLTGQGTKPESPIDYFFKQGLTFKDGTKLSKRYIAIRLSHLPHTLKHSVVSQYKDRLNRNNRTTAIKWWWWVTKTSPVQN